MDKTFNFSRAQKVAEITGLQRLHQAYQNTLSRNKPLQSGQPAIPQSGYVSVIPAATSTSITPVTTAGVTATTTPTTTLSVSGVQVVDVSPTTGASVLVSASMPVSPDDKPVTDAWLASLEQKAREKWIV